MHKSLSARALVAAVAVASGVLSVGAWAPGAGAGVAVATSANVVLDTSLPGFTLAPAGAFNGPVSAATLLKLTDTDDTAMLSEIESGALDAYLRCWSRPFGESDGVLADLVMRFPTTTQATQFIVSFDLALKAESDVTSFAISSPSGARAYMAHGVIVQGSTNYAVTVARGRFATFVLSATPAGGVSLSQIELLAYSQWAAFPHGTGSGASDDGRGSISAGALYLLPPATLSSSGIGGLEALFVLVLIVVGLGLLALFGFDAWRRRRGPGRDQGDAEAGLSGLDESVGGGVDGDEVEVPPEGDPHWVFADSEEPGPGG